MYVYRKLLTTDTIMAANYCKLPEYKIYSIRYYIYYIHRLYIYMYIYISTRKVFVFLVVVIFELILLLDF